MGVTWPSATGKLADRYAPDGCPSNRASIVTPPPRGVGVVLQVTSIESPAAAIASVSRARPARVRSFTVPKAIVP